MRQLRHGRSRSRLHIPRWTQAEAYNRGPCQENNCGWSKWANFYVVASAAAATLLGLLFVVITLAAERGRQQDAPKIKIYLTPVVVYFGSVLLMSATLTVPNQTRLTAVTCICIEGAIGLGYAGTLAIKRDTRNAFVSLSDLFPYVIFPFAGYAVIVVGGLLLLKRPQNGLDLVAAGMLVLLGIAIRNSWAIAVTIVSGPS